MSWKYKITIDGKVHTTNVTREYNHLVKCKKIVDFLIANDLNYNKAIEKFGYSTTNTLRVTLKAIGFDKVKTTYGELTKSQVIKAIKRHQAGEDIKYIAAEYKVSPDGLRARIRLRGYSIKNRKYIKAEYEKEPPTDNRSIYDRILYNSTLSFI